MPRPDAYAARAAHGHQARAPLRGTGLGMQGRQTRCGTPGLEHATAKPAGAGVRPGLHGTGCAPGCAAVSLLQVGAAALRGHAAWEHSPTGAGRRNATTGQSGATMSTRRCLGGVVVASHSKRVGASVRQCWIGMLCRPSDALAGTPPTTVNHPTIAKRCRQLTQVRQ